MAVISSATASACGALLPGGVSVGMRMIFWRKSISSSKWSSIQVASWVGNCAVTILSAQIVRSDVESFYVFATGWAWLVGFDVELSCLLRLLLSEKAVRRASVVLVRRGCHSLSRANFESGVCVCI